MAAGDLITEDWEMEYNGVAVGGDNPILASRVTGLLDLPDISSGDQGRLRRHGLHPGDDFLMGRSVTIAFEIHGDTQGDFDTALSSLLTMTKPGEDEAQLFFQVPGVAGGDKAFLWCRPRKRKVTIDREYYYNLAKVIVQFDATDPRLYLATTATGATAVAAASGGFAFPLSFPLAFGAAGEPGTIAATNTGTFAAGAIFRIDGPITNPRIENTTHDKTIEVDITLSASEHLILDTEAGTVLLNGTASRYSSLASTSEWFDIEPGANLITFRGSSATGATMSMSWGHAFV